MVDDLGIRRLHARGLMLAPGAPWTSALSDWELDPWVVLPLLLTGGCYLRGVLALRQRRARSRAARRAMFCFVAGWLTLVLALVSPVHELSEQLFSMHMVQHELLMVVAAPLLVLARPMPVLLFGLPRGWRPPVAAVLRARPTRQMWARVARPIDAWVLHGLAIWVWHLPLLFDATLTSPLVHALQHISFFWSAVIFWWAMLYGQRRAARAMSVIYLFTTGVHTSVLGALITFSRNVWYPGYATATAAIGISPIADQQLAGLIMWIPGGVAYLAATLAIMWRWLAESEWTAAASDAAVVLPR